MKHGAMNPITGDELRTKVSKKYAENLDKVNWEVKDDKVKGEVVQDDGVRFRKVYK